MADQTLLSTIAPVSIILSLVLGKYMLKEQIYKKHFYSCAFMIVGAILALSFAHMDSSTYDVHEIEKRIYSSSSIALVSGIVVMMIILMILSRKIIKDISKIGMYLSEKEAKHNLLKSPNSRIQDKSEGSSMSFVQPLVLFSEEERIEILTKVKKECVFTNPQWLKVPVAVYPWFSGFFSGLLALTAKCGIMLLVHIHEGDNAKYFTPYLMIILKPVLTIGELFLLNMGLKYFDTCYVMPIFKASVVFHHML